MVTQAQIRFFDQLLEERDFGAKTKKDVDQLRESFAQLDKRSASVWIEKALGLPKVEAPEQAEIIQPAF